MARRRKRHGRTVQEPVVCVMVHECVIEVSLRQGRHKECDEDLDLENHRRPPVADVQDQNYASRPKASKTICRDREDRERFAICVCPSPRSPMHVQAR